ncbi:hypothetical protein PR048_015617 [Dryococelus australis]|uniref:Reverse transcriptase domain-containing protein n=1 Tax=Dryococelus australis TaxID=614101 RepID=A0ABQ9HIH3_9NEOP|nr:hypothetical protein PR048_015617 [Dryococelus australis]
MLDEEIIVPSSSPWSAPIILVMEKTANGIKIRPVIDFSVMNQVTKRFVNPLLLINETLDMLGWSKFFTTMDCINGQSRRPRENMLFYYGRTLPLFADALWIDHLSQYFRQINE